MCDGNLAALHSYERQQEANEIAYDELLERVRPYMEEAIKQLDMAQELIEESGFDIGVEDLLNEY